MITKKKKVSIHKKDNTAQNITLKVYDIKNQFSEKLSPIGIVNWIFGDWNNVYIDTKVYVFTMRKVLSLSDSFWT